MKNTIKLDVTDDGGINLKELSLLRKKQRSIREKKKKKKKREKHCKIYIKYFFVLYFNCIILYYKYCIQNNRIYP